MSGGGRDDAGDVRRLVYVLALAGFASTFGFRMIDPLVPDIARDLNVSLAAAASLATAYALTYAVAQPVFGPIGDAVGKIFLIRLGTAGMALAFVATAFAPDFASLSLARAITGVAAGGIVPVVLAAIADRVPVERRQVVIGRFLFSILAAQLAGTVGAGVLSGPIGWRGVFLVAATISAVSFLAISIFLDGRRVPSPEPMSLSTIRGRYQRIFHNRQALPLYLIVALEGVLLTGLQPYVAAILQERAPVGAFEAGLVISGIGLGGLVYSLTVGWLLWLLGQKAFTIAGACLSALSLAAFALSAPWFVDMAIFVVLGFGFLMVHNTLQVLATELSVELRGAAISLFAFSFFLGQALGPLMFGGLYHALGAQPALLLLALAVVGFGLVARFMLFRPPPA